MWTLLVARISINDLTAGTQCYSEFIWLFSQFYAAIFYSFCALMELLFTNYNFEQFLWVRLIWRIFFQLLLPAPKKKRENKCTKCILSWPFFCQSGGLPISLSFCHGFWLEGELQTGPWAWLRDVGLLTCLTFQERYVLGNCLTSSVFDWVKAAPLIELHVGGS